MNKKQDNFIQNVLKGIGRRLKGFAPDKSKKAGLTWFKIKQLKHMPYNRPGRFHFRGSYIYFNNGPELLHSLQEIFSDDIYDIAFDTDHPYILDCGANIGLSVLYLKMKYPKAKIVAFEPDPSNFGLLQKNISGYQLKDVELRNEAIWKENTTLKFVSDGTLGSKVNSETGSENAISVKAAKLRDLLTKQVDFLKIDIEGAEYEVLKDCNDSLSMVKYLFIEFHGFFDKMYELTDILELVQNNGFAYYIKEASNVYPTPFNRSGLSRVYDVQLNIFCFRIN